MTQEARRFKIAIRAASWLKSAYMKQAERVKRGGPVRRAINALFVTSQVGIADDKIGMGPRRRSHQNKFRKELIEFYGADTTHPNKPKVVLEIHDSGTGNTLPKEVIFAAHLVPWSTDPNMLIAFFGENAWNGLLLSKAVETALDEGAILPVPDIREGPSTEDVAKWEAKEPKNYRWRVLDEDAECLDAILIPPDSGSQKMSVRDLNGRPLPFKNNNRPRARYLY
ncbi:hypothetical protein EJ06DRAFT_472629 [Trichodelitschia bisporula]|uniref:HNH nuclease domain-containing protein n=1 Tax=Trichodelitschia bisporula TaxID=703511 RepID=A0A6G1I585_9PEZI|nr:hypothetical protein EJ06DRAFT_472629 [Trichodelitschia bisporula]